MLHFTSPQPGVSRLALLPVSEGTQVRFSNLERKYLTGRVWVRRLMIMKKTFLQTIDAVFYNFPSSPLEQSSRLSLQQG